MKFFMNFWVWSLCELIFWFWSLQLCDSIYGTTHHRRLPRHTSSPVCHVAVL